MPASISDAATGLDDIAAKTLTHRDEPGGAQELGVIAEGVVALAKLDDDVGKDRLAAAPRYGQEKFEPQWFEYDLMGGIVPHLILQSERNWPLFSLLLSQRGCGRLIFFWSLPVMTPDADVIKNIGTGQRVRFLSIRKVPVPQGFLLKQE
jgi:hypothetical protein